MSLAIVRSRALLGLEAPEVQVEVHLSNGLPAFHIVGLPQAAVRESRDRVRAALLHCGFEFPNRRLTVNLTPADLPKDSGRYDLPVAVGVLAATGQLPVESLDGLELVGELSLTGEVRAIRGALAMVLAVRAAGGSRRLLLPAACRDEAALVPDCQTLVADSLPAVCAHLRGEAPLERVDGRLPAAPADAVPDFDDVRGQWFARRALEVAAAGGHSILLIGSPGAGKSMLAQRFIGLLPDLDTDEALECAVVQSIAARFDPARWARRPFRSPHHTASPVALAGGGNPPRPGEVTLAHRGVLFLDELPEFGRAALEILREPLESGEITLSRAARQATYPARFQLIAAMNPCPCGYAGSPLRECRCSQERVLRYQRALSGPLLDRIDLRIEVAPVPPEALEQGPGGEPTATIRSRVAATMALQTRRQGCLNARLPPGRIDQVCVASAAARTLMRDAATRLGWSARAWHRVLRIARTLADLAGAEAIDESHVAEAVQLRRALAPG